MTYVWDINCYLPHSTGPDVIHPLQEIIQSNLHQPSHLTVRKVRLFLQNSPQSTETCKEKSNTRFIFYPVSTD